MPTTRELALKEELNKINLVIAKLQDYQDDALSDLPEELLKLIKSITVLPKFSSTGLESINSILNNLYICRFIANKIIAGEPLPGEEGSQGPEPQSGPRPGPKTIVSGEMRAESSEIQNAPRPKTIVSSEMRAESSEMKAELKNKETPVEEQSSLRGDAKEQKNIEPQPGPRPRPKVAESGELRAGSSEIQNAPRPKQIIELGIRNNELGVRKIQDKKDASLVKLEDISHIEPPTQKQTIPSTPPPILTKAPPKKSDPLDPFE